MHCQKSLIEAHGLTYILPDGSPLFAGLEIALPSHPVGLVGRNGIGKTVLGKILAGIVAPSRGQVIRHGRLAHIPQNLPVGPEETIADVLNCSAILSALQMVDEGRARDADFDLLQGYWDLPQRLERFLGEQGLDYLRVTDFARRLSGGELTRLLLVRALLADPQGLILDEPTNHLDRANRDKIGRFVASWRGGLLLISHDRELLELVGTVWELTSKGIKSYGGGYSFYAEKKGAELAALEREIVVARDEVQRKQLAAQAAVERQLRQNSRGRAERARGGMPKMVLDARQDRCENTGHRLQSLNDTRVNLAQEKLRECSERLEIVKPIGLALAPTEVGSSKQVVRIENLGFGYGRPLFVDFNFAVVGPQRWAIHGGNGSGKTTLLKLIVGALRPERGRISIGVNFAYLDQGVSILAAEKSALANFLALNPGLSEGECRQRLAYVRLRGDKALIPVGQLSGGERLKAGLACVLLGQEPAQLLLLDEPTNHLDLDSLAAVEVALAAYKGALIVVSHDRHFLANIGIDNEVSMPTVQFLPPADGG